MKDRVCHNARKYYAGQLCQKALLWTLLWALLVVPALAWSNSVFQVRVLNKGKEAETGVVTLIAPEMVITSNGLVEQGDRYLIMNDETNTELRATIVHSDKNADVVLLKVPGLDANPIPISKDPSLPGRNMYIALPDDQRRKGVIHSLLPKNDKTPYPLVQHTARYDNRGFGAPVLNNCNELLGISITQMQGLFSKTPLVPEEFSSFVDTASLKEILTTRNIKWTEVDSECLSIESKLDEAREKTKKLEKEKEKLEEESEVLAKQRQDLEKLTNEQKAELAEKEETIAAREKAHKEAEEKLKEQEEVLRKEKEEHDRVIQEKKRVMKERADLAQENRRKDRQRRIIVGVAGCVFLLLVLFIIRRRRSTKAVEEKLETELERQKKRKKILEVELGKAR